MSLQLLGIARPLHLDGSKSGFDVAQIVGRKGDIGRREILIQAMTFGGSGDRYNPGFLREQPGQGNLRRSGVTDFRKPGQNIDELPVRSARFRRKARLLQPEVVAGERGVLIDGTREEALAERTERHKADPELLKRR